MGCYRCTVMTVSGIGCVSTDVGGIDGGGNTVMIVCAIGVQ